MVGRTLDRYRLLEQVGQGGMAIVYRALDVPLEREVAVKVLHPHLAGHPEARARLQREAQAVAKLRHENILEIFASSGEGSSDSYLVTEFIHGPTLKAFITEHPLPLPELGAMMVSEVAQALSCAHAVGILHRDIKPENVMVRRGGTLVLCDFGIAQVIDKDRMTATGQLLGSPAYMAPEHIEGRPLGPPSDLFSLGVLLYQLVTGELPFRGRNPHETLKRISDGHYTAPEELQPLCGARLSRVVSRALCHEPEGRYESAAALREDLLAVLRESGLSRPREELRAFFLDPERWVQEARPRIARALCQAGVALRDEGRTAAALAAWGRAQLLAPADGPEHRELSTLIRGVARRTRLRRAAAAAALLALVGSGAAGVTVLLRRRSPGPPAAGVAVTRPPAPPAVAAPMDAARPRPGERGAPAPSSMDAPRLAMGPALPGVGPPVAAPRDEARPRPALVGEGPPGPRRPPGRRGARSDGARLLAAGPGQSPPAAHAGPRVVHLAPLPKAVQVSLNGKLLGAYGSDVTSVTLPPGANELLFENPACYSERVVIPADADPGDVRVRLRWKPALLLVRVPAGPRDVDVVVEGRIGRAGQVLALPLRGEDGRTTVELRASAAGHRTLVQRVEVRANQLTTLDISLEPG